MDGVLLNPIFPLTRNDLFMLLRVLRKESVKKIDKITELIAL